MEAGAAKRVAVLGAGTIGASWVAWFLARGTDSQKRTRETKKGPPGGGPQVHKTKTGISKRLRSRRGRSILASGI